MANEERGGSVPIRSTVVLVVPKRGEGRQNLDQGLELAVRAATGHHGLWPFLLCTSGCAGFYRSWPRPGVAKLTRTSSLWSCATKCGPLSASSMAASGAEKPTAPSWPPSAGSSLATAGGGSEASDGR